MRDRDAMQTALCEEFNLVIEERGPERKRERERDGERGVQEVHTSLEESGRQKREIGGVFS